MYDPNKPPLPSMSKDLVAARLKQARQKVFSTAAEAAEALGMNPVTVRAHESGRNGVSYYDLERYARRYGVAQMWLLMGEGAEEPTTNFTSELGELLYIDGYVEDDAWYPAETGREGFDGYVRTPEGYAERVAYTDPRFPEGMVGALKVKTSFTNKTYIDGTVLFCVDRSEMPISPGDHVIVVRTRGEFDNLSVRLVVADEGGWVLQSLTSDNPPVLMRETEKEEVPHITALVVGSLTRRPAPRIGVDQIRAWEQNAAAARRIHDAENAEIAERYWSSEKPDDA